MTAATPSLASADRMMVEVLGWIAAARPDRPPLADLERALTTAEAVRLGLVAAKAPECLRMTLAGWRWLAEVYAPVAAVGDVPAFRAALAEVLAERGAGA